MPDNHYLNARLAALYDYDSPWSEDRDFYLALADQEHMDILDLGCGTGLICDRYAAAGHNVTGADPAGAMLDVARTKTHGARIDWVLSNAQDFTSDKRFDLIIMTGHAFQVLVDDKDIDAAFASISKHLKPQGRFVFESRNPHWDWAKGWRYQLDLAAPGGMVKESRILKSFDGNIMTFDLAYDFGDETLMSSSVLRFLTAPDITARLAAQGLQVTQLLGDWDGTAYDTAKSQEIIFVTQKQTVI